MIRLFIIFFSMFSLQAFSQETFAGNIRSTRKFGLGITLIGPTSIISAGVDYYLSNNLNLDAGATIDGYYGGFKIYLGAAGKPSRWSPYVGAL